MILDAFLFHEELELLSLRLEELAGVVDRHILVESTWTLSGQPKPLTYLQHKSQFAGVARPIDHVIVTGMPLGPDHSLRETYQRECISHALVGYDGDTVLLLSDADELPRPELIESFAGAPGVTRFDMVEYAYWLNCRVPMRTRCSRMVRLRDLPHGSIQALRRHPGDQILTDAGWHFTSMGGAERVRRKLQSFAHGERARPEFLDRVDAAIVEGFDLGQPALRYDFVPLDQSYPRTMLAHLDRWRPWIAGDAQPGSTSRSADGDPEAVAAAAGLAHAGREARDG